MRVEKLFLGSDTVSALTEIDNEHREGSERRGDQDDDQSGETTLLTSLTLWRSSPKQKLRHGVSFHDDGVG
jgi:hypothetical protein